MLPLGSRHPWHPPRGALNSLVMVVATPRGIGTCEFLRSQPSQHTPHKCQFLQIMWTCRVWMTVPAMRVHELSPYRRDRAVRCTS